MVNGDGEQGIWKVESECDARAVWMQGQDRRGDRVDLREHFVRSFSVLGFDLCLFCAHYVSRD